MSILALPGARHRAEDFELDPVAIEALWRMEDRHFWHAARNGWIARAFDACGLVRCRILDVGCGSGVVARQLSRRGHAVTGIDTAEVLVRKADQRCPSATFIVGELAELPPEHVPFDAICFFDVFEHLDEPRALLSTALRFARDGTLIIATVPALSSLHSLADRAGGHKKRYEPGELARFFAEAGLREIEERGIFRAIWPILRAWRRDDDGRPLSIEERRRIWLSDCRLPPAPINAVLGLLCALELRLGFASARGKPAPTLLCTARV